MVNTCVYKICPIFCTHPVQSHSSTSPKVGVSAVVNGRPLSVTSPVGGASSNGSNRSTCTLSPITSVGDGSYHRTSNPTSNSSSATASVIAVTSSVAVMSPVVSTASPLSGAVGRPAAVASKTSVKNLSRISSSASNSPQCMRRKLPDSNRRSAVQWPQPAV